MKQASRGPTVLYLVLTVVMLVLVAGLAFSARAPAPPQIAELTPQANHQITKAPSQLSSIGAAAGSKARSPTTTTTSTTLSAGGGGPASASPPATADVAAVHHCYGNPPRQIPFDTQSPPCIAYWAGNNGGATSTGVTATTIRVIDANSQDASWNDANVDPGHRVSNDLFAFFNRYMELYGRKLVPEYPPAGPTGSTCTDVNAYADGLAAQYKPFATDSLAGSSSVCYRTEMARDHVISTGQRQWIPTPVVNSYAPYLWSYTMSGEDQMANEGAFICAQLAHKKAVYSPDPTIAAQTRKFGLIMVYDETDYPPSPAPLEQSLARCGVQLAAKEVYEVNYDNGSGQGEGQAQQDVLAMQNAGVTTVLCSCDVSNAASEEYIPPAADSQHYFPEWILTYANNTNFDVNLEWHDPAQQKALMGMTFKPAQVPYPETTINQALNAVDPGFQVSNFEAMAYLQRMYWELLEIASGIQMAGPDLTPYTFQRGLQLAGFPNPPSPEMEGVVGFGTSSHFMTDDAAVMWWGSSAPGPYPDEGAGAWCYVDGAERFSVAKGNWSAPMNLFDGNCQSSPPGT